MNLPMCLPNYYLGQVEMHLVEAELPCFELRHKSFTLHCNVIVKGVKLANVFRNHH